MGKKLAALVLTLFCMGSICQAAVSDVGAGDYYKKEKELYREKSVPEKETVSDKTPQENEPSKPNDLAINVSQILLNNSEILAEAELKKITSNYEGKKLTIKDLYTLTAEINALYKAKGYITARAILPPQKIQDGIVKIQLVEGRVGEIQVEGNQYTNTDYIKDRISLQKGDLLKLDKLQNDIFYFNNTNDVAMRGELRPGKTVGTTDCVLRVQEPDEWQVTLFSDNAGSEESGKYRIGMIIANNSLFGNREALVLNPTWTKGTMAGSASYTFPADRLGTRIGLSYSKNQTNIISGPYESLDIDGHSSDIGFSVTRPLLVNQQRKLDGYAELHWKDSDTSFSGNTLLGSETKTATLGANLRTVGNKTVWYSQLSGTAIASSNNTYHNKRFSRYNFSSIRQEELYKDISLIWRFSGQWTNSKELPSTEKFSLGGMSSVKGFAESYVSGERGYYVGVEYDFPTSCNKIKGLLFADHGSTYSLNEIGQDSKEYLTSAGFGLIFNNSANVFGKVVVGLPITSSKVHDSVRVHFFVQTNIK